LVEGVVPIRPEPALFEAMLEGWRRQQSARRLSAGVVDGRERLVRRFQEFTGVWPWQWTPAQIHLAPHLPAAVLADLFNLAPTTAACWMHEAGAD
jgi:hypothetical protein